MFDKKKLVFWPKRTLKSSFSPKTVPKTLTCQRGPPASGWRHRGGLLLPPPNSTVSHHPPGRPGLSPPVTVADCPAWSPPSPEHLSVVWVCPTSRRTAPVPECIIYSTSHNTIYDSWLYTHSPFQPPLQLHERRSTRGLLLSLSVNIVLLIIWFMIHDYTLTHLLSHHSSFTRGGPRPRRRASSSRPSVKLED